MPPKEVIHYARNNLSRALEVREELKMKEELKLQPRFIRTMSGDIWELDRNTGNYRKPNCSTVVELDNESVVASSDQIKNLIRENDLILSIHGKRIHSVSNKVQSQSFKDGVTMLFIYNNCKQGFFLTATREKGKELELVCSKK